MGDDVSPMAPPASRRDGGAALLHARRQQVSPPVTGAGVFLSMPPSWQSDLHPKLQFCGPDMLKCACTACPIE